MREFLLTSDGFFDYLVKALRAASIYKTFDRLATYSRRFLLVTKILKWILTLVGYIVKSAVILVFAVLALAILPFVLLLALVYFVADNIRASLLLRGFELSGGKIYVIFNSGSFGEGFAGSLDGEVFLVKGQLTERFFGMKRVGGLTYISSSFFIRLRRSHFDAIGERMCYLF